MAQVPGRKTTRRGDPRPGRYGQPYEIGEIALIYSFKRGPKAMAMLAQLLERTEDSIDLIWGWCEGRKFPKAASNEIHRQVERVRELFGAGMMGKIELSD